LDVLPGAPRENGIKTKSFFGFMGYEEIYITFVSIVFRHSHFTKDKTLINFAFKGKINHQ